ncbi:FlgD immunoglobulin-like domain containing protein [Candidatus Eisenbacteria bacterium]|uniref:FlgD immunoglobulin-like domain containing protein n=1 Tax=Eiseniibacteriota bacterium TaxID=2212470 RepID=A0ABV6YPG8_UNCEI
MKNRPGKQGSKLLAGIFIFIALTLSTSAAMAVWLAEERLTDEHSPSITSNNNAWCVAVDPAGDVNVVWTDYRSADNGVYHKSFDGWGWSSVSRISLPTAIAHNPSVACDAIGGLHVVWTDYRHGNAETYYRAYDGAAWGEYERVSSAADISSSPSIAAHDSGQVHIVWHDYRDGDWEIYYRSFDGAAWSSEQRLTDQVGNSLYASVATRGDGAVLVVWQDYRDGNHEIYYKCFDGTWGSDERLTSDAGSSEKPSVAVDSGGDVHVVWQDDRDGAWEIYHKVSVSGVWGAAERLTHESVSATEPSIAADTSGGVHIVWKDQRDGNEEIYYRSHDGLVWGAEWRMSIDDGASEHSSIAAGPDGNMAMVWQDDRDGNTEIYARRFTPGPFPPPMIASISPSQGHTDFVVTITDLAGEDFLYNAAVMLQLAGKPDIIATSVDVESSQKITCLFDLAGATVGAWDVVVENPDSQLAVLEEGFEVTPWPKPELTSIEPDRGYAGQIIDDASLSGNDFRAPALVWFEKPMEPDLPATDVDVISPTRVDFDIDLTGATPGNWTVILENPDGQRDTLVWGFAVWPWPDVVVNSVIPDGGYPGQQIDDFEIRGDGFKPSANAWLQKLGETPVPPSNVVVHSPFRVTCDISLPTSGTGLWDVVVENPDLEQGILAEGFSLAYFDAPQIASISPFEGVAGDHVMITDLAGDCFNDLASVWLQGPYDITIHADNIVVESPQKITCEFDLMEAITGYLDVVVMHPDGPSDTLTSGFRVIQGEWSSDLRLTDAAHKSSLSGGNARCIAADGLGNLHAVWFDERHGDSEIYYRVHDGISWGAEERITNAANESENPAIVIDSNNTVHVFWADRMRGDWEIYYISKDLSGWSDIECLTDAQYLVNNPSVATDSNNDLHVVWQARTASLSYQIIYKRTQDGVWLPPDTLALAYPDHRDPSIAVDGAGDVHVVWKMFTVGDACIRYRKSDGSTWEPDISLVCRPEAGSPSLQADADGKLHLAFIDRRFGDFEVFYKRFDGAGWHAAVRLSDGPAKSIQPSVVSDGTGEVTVVWSDERNGDHTFEIYSKHFDGASWGPESRLTYVPGTSCCPSAAVNMAGTVQVIWSDNRDGNFEIYYKVRGDDASAGFGDERVAGTVADPIRVLPNPFREGVEIRLAHPAGRHATVSVYDVSGRMVWERHVRSGPNNRVSVAWDGHSSDGNRVAPGIYFVEVSTARHSASTKMIVLR